MKSREEHIVGLLFGFLVLLRSLPEVIIGTYPAGYDTSYYAALLVSNGRGVELINSPLFYLPFIFVGRTLNADPFLAVKVLSVVLYGALGVSVYIFARRALNWKISWSLFTALLFSLQIVTLRISWDLLKNEFGLVLLLLTLTYLAREKRVEKPLALITLFLLFLANLLTHLLTFALLTAVVIYLAITQFAQRKPKTGVKLLGCLLPALIIFIIAFSSPVVILQERQNITHISPFTVERVNKLIFNYMEEGSPWFSNQNYLVFASEVLQLFLFLYIPILPLVIFGVWRNDVLTPITLICLVGSFSCLVYPYGALPLAQRWMYMLVLPFSLYAANCVRKIVKRVKISSRALKWLVLAPYLILAVNYLVGVVPITANPAIIKHIPPKMTHSSLDIGDIQGAIDVLTWANKNLTENTAIVIEQRFFGWSLIFLDKEQTVVVYPANLEPDTAINYAKGNFNYVYFIWYEGQYAEFQEVYKSGRIVLYRVV